MYLFSKCVSILRGPLSLLKQTGDIMKAEDTYTLRDVIQQFVCLNLVNTQISDELKEVRRQQSFRIGRTTVKFASSFLLRINVIGIRQ